MKKPYLKYKNPDKRCKFPFFPESIGYCWSFAEHVDYKTSKEEMIKKCEKCEYWKPEEK